MIKLRDEYELLKNKSLENQRKINLLKNNIFFKSFFELIDEKSKIKFELANLYIKIKTNEFSTCKHVLILTRVDHDYMEGRTYRYYGCIKCGLDQSVLSDNFSRNWLNDDQKIMYDYLQDHSLDNNINTGIHCDLELAKKIYSQIKKDHPNIYDEKALKYFKIEIEDNKDNIKKLNK